MALRTPLSLNPKFLPKFTKSQFHSTPSSIYPIIKTNFKICCINKKEKDTSDAELAASLAVEMTKINTRLVQKQEAMKKSKELLLKEFCKYLGLDTGEVKQKWRNMDETEKMVWAKGFVAHWGEAFHPLSSKSVREMVDEILVEEQGSGSSSSGINFDNLKKMIGF
ncbi:hypothetical protein ACHQM5_023831 [Ranunculus cassubicifolius]